MATTPTIIRNPANDQAFQLAIEEILAGGVTDPEVAQERLRERYPRAVIRPRDLESELMPVWYAYREGHWTAGD